ncbi:unnamed protein product [Lepeophtheirus salmonis]|uniref:(salmon louse) hypothetical protein n=1 Tax=Lepeophtheirus salmonis TaxID=72036 RepID=A0A7R8H4B3_LEPSM|nr:unnamed protein product [Lepeophtheirus salmonis]CAF2860065.1 unnamed protein product [Lepeophtheirus salmonis]
MAEEAIHLITWVSFHPSHPETPLVGLDHLQVQATYLILVYSWDPLPTSLPQLYTLNAASRENPSPLSLFSQWSAVQAAGLLASSSSTITNTTSTPSSSPPTSSGSSSCVPSRPSPFSSSLRFSPYILPPSKGGSFNTANVCGSGGRDPSPSRLSPPTSEGIPSSTPSP